MKPKPEKVYQLVDPDTWEVVGEITRKDQKNTISRLEREVNGLTDQMATAICREYGVSKEWLRDGEGEMFAPVTRNEKIARFAGELMKDETPDFQRQLVEILADLDDDGWEALACFAEKLAGLKK